MPDPKPTLDSPAIWVCQGCGREIVLPENVPVDEIMATHRITCGPLQPRKAVLA